MFVHHEYRVLSRVQYANLTMVKVVSIIYIFTIAISITIITVMVKLLPPIIRKYLKVYEFSSTVMRVYVRSGDFVAIIYYIILIFDFFLSSLPI